MWADTNENITFVKIYPALIYTSSIQYKLDMKESQLK